MTPARWVGQLEKSREDALRAFFLDWHGMGRVPRTFPSHVPLPLRWLYEHVGASTFIRQNTLVSPGAMELDADGRRIFYVENQGVCVWSTEAGDDPAVWIRWENKPKAEREEESLSGFVLQIALFETIARSGQLATLSSDDARWLESSLAPVPLAPWMWPGWPGRFFASEEVIAFSSANGRDRDVWITATNGESLARTIAPFAKSFR